MTGHNGMEKNKIGHKHDCIVATGRQQVSKSFIPNDTSKNNKHDLHKAISSNKWQVSHSCTMMPTLLKQSSSSDTTGEHEQYYS